MRKSTARRSVLLPPPLLRSAAPASPWSRWRPPGFKREGKTERGRPINSPAAPAVFFAPSINPPGEREVAGAARRQIRGVPSPRRGCLFLASKSFSSPLQRGEPGKGRDASGGLPAPAPPPTTRRGREDGARGQAGALDFTFVAVATQSGHCLFSPAAAAAASLPLPRRRPLPPLVQGSLDRVLPGCRGLLLDSKRESEAPSRRSRALPPHYKPSHPPSPATLALVGWRLCHLRPEAEPTFQRGGAGAGEKKGEGGTGNAPYPAARAASAGEQL